jgi:hypothetical protein
VLSASDVSEFSDFRRGSTSCPHKSKKLGKDLDPDLDTIDTLARMIGKSPLMTGIEASAAKHAAGAGHVFARSSGVVHLLDLP